MIRTIQLNLSKLKIFTISFVILIGAIELMRITTGNPIQFFKHFLDPILNPVLPLWILAVNVSALACLIIVLWGVYRWFSGIIISFKKYPLKPSSDKAITGQPSREKM